ncbi:hypothetical protein FHR76_002208 [Rhizobium sp. RAS22]|nr:hypothetical protein [Rhizobium sp. RAS22]
MDLTNNPNEGTGYTVAEAANVIESYLDSETTTPENVDAETETDVSDTSDDEIDLSEDDDADHVEDDAEEEMSEDENTDEETAKDELSDETTIEVNGNNVSLKELKQGYLRQSDYTKKTQELSAEKEKYKAGQIDAHAIRAELGAKLDNYGRLLAIEFQGLTEPNWSELAESDPADYVKQKESWNRKNALIKAHYDMMNEKRREDAEFIKNQLADAQVKAFEEMGNRYPEFKDSKTSNHLLGSIENYLVARNFSDTEIEGIANPEVIDIVYKAMRFDQMQANASKAVKYVEQKPRMTMPQTGTKPSKAETDLDAGSKRLKQSGRVEDAADLFSKYFK